MMPKMLFMESKLTYHIKFGDSIIEMKSEIFQLQKLIEIIHKKKFNLLLLLDLIYLEDGNAIGRLDIILTLMDF